MKKIFITGATSYLGKLFIKYNPELKFFALQNRSKIIDTPNVKVVNNPEEMINIVENEQITQFIHLANMFKGLKISVDEMYDKNVFFYQLISKSKIENFIYSSSYWVDIEEYNKKQYVIDKLQNEELIFNLNRKKINSTILRFGDIFGPDDNRDKLIPYLKKNENNPKIEFKNSSDAIIRPTHIKHAISAIKYYLFLNLNFCQKVDVYSKELSLEKFINKYIEVHEKNFEPTFNNLNFRRLTYKSSSDLTYLPENSIKDYLKII